MRNQMEEEVLGASLEFPNWEMEEDAFSGRANFHLENVSEDASLPKSKQVQLNFIPARRYGKWSDIGGRPNMEDTHICVPDLASSYGYPASSEGAAISFYGVFDGHGGKGAAQFVRDHLPRIIVEDSEFPLGLEKVITRSFMEVDAAFEKACSNESTLSSGTTALIVMIYGRSLLVANAGDCRAVLSRNGVAIEMSVDHRPCCLEERLRIEKVGGFIDDGYLNGQLSVTRALGNWHIKGLKEGGLLSKPEVKQATLTKDDEFIIIGSDGIWDVFRSQNAVDFARRRLQEHNNIKRCCMDIVDEAKKRGATDNLTVVMVCFHNEPPPRIASPRTRVRRCISVEGLQSLKFLLQ